MSATHHARLVPKPTARVGSLLEMIQLARLRDSERNAGGRAHVQRARELCLAAAETHAELLERLEAREGVRSYVINCPVPWEGLWLQVEKVLPVGAGAR